MYQAFTFLLVSFSPFLAPFSTCIPLYRLLNLSRTTATKKQKTFRIHAVPFAGKGAVYVIFCEAGRQCLILCSSMLWLFLQFSRFQVQKFHPATWQKSAEFTMLDNTKTCVWQCTTHMDLPHPAPLQGAKSYKELVCLTVEQAQPERLETTRTVVTLDSANSDTWFGLAMFEADMRGRARPSWVGKNCNSEPDRVLSMKAYVWTRKTSSPWAKGDWTVFIHFYYVGALHPQHRSRSRNVSWFALPPFIGPSAYAMIHIWYLDVQSCRKRTT